jgi:hypothetical protein
MSGAGRNLSLDLRPAAAIYQEDNMRCALSETPPRRELVSFDVLDKRGRVVGARITRNEHTYTEGGDRAWYEQTPGTFYAFTPHATRNGETYGASQRTVLCATPEEREAAIAKYLRAARKRAAK